jgi:hypothetical protein
MSQLRIDGSNFSRDRHQWFGPRVRKSSVGASQLLAWANSMPAHPQEMRLPKGRRCTLPLAALCDAPHTLPQRKAGDLIRSPEFQEYDLPVHLAAIRIRYHLRNANGQDAVTSGAALHLDGKAPQGWRLIAWAHAFARSRLPVRHEEMTGHIVRTVGEPDWRSIHKKTWWYETRQA